MIKKSSVAFTLVLILTAVASVFLEKCELSNGNQSIRWYYPRPDWSVDN